MDESATLDAAEHPVPDCNSQLGYMASPTSIEQLDACVALAQFLE